VLTLAPSPLWSIAAGDADVAADVGRGGHAVTIVGPSRICNGAADARTDLLAGIAASGATGAPTFIGDGCVAAVLRTVPHFVGAGGRGKTMPGAGAAEDGGGGPRAAVNRGAAAALSNALRVGTLQ
jgi:hypothetical protein